MYTFVYIMNSNYDVLVCARVTPRTRETLDKMVSDGIARSRSDAVRIVLDRSIGEESERA